MKTYVVMELTDYAITTCTPAIPLFRFIVNIGLNIS